jgi:hypothetical protein
MTENANLKNVDNNCEDLTKLYSPSWINRFTAWVDGKKLPAWTYYIGIAAVLLIIQASVMWTEGEHPIGTIFTIQAFLGGMTSYFLIFIHYLNKRAEKALKVIKPALDVSEEEFRGLSYHLTTMPFFPSLLAGVAATAFAFLLAKQLGRPGSFEVLSGSPISSNLIYIVYLIAWYFFGTFYYHAVRQLRQISRVYTRCARINLLMMRPLYAFSGLTAITAVAMTACVYLFFAIDPVSFNSPFSVWLTIVVSILAFVAFIWPMLGVHGLLEKEKERLLDETASRFQALTAELHRCVDESDLEGVGGLNTAVATLLMEQSAVKSIPTWPWQPETVRVLITAIVLPLVLWISQYVFQLILK